MSENWESINIGEFMEDGTAEFGECLGKSLERFLSGKKIENVPKNEISNMRRLHIKIPKKKRNINFKNKKRLEKRGRKKKEIISEHEKKLKTSFKIFEIPADIKNKEHAIKGFPQEPPKWFYVNKN